jgi:hypothetical protein
MLSPKADTMPANSRRFEARVERSNQPAAKGRTLAAPPSHETTVMVRRRRVMREA